jgi:molecular chaperone GrpE (heat shock protein)
MQSARAQGRSGDGPLESAIEITAEPSAAFQPKEGTVLECAARVASSENDEVSDELVDRSEVQLQTLASELCAAMDGSMRPRLDEIADELKQLGARQEELNRLFESRIGSEEAQAKAMESMHDQLRDYKTNFVREEMKPLLRDLTFCYDFAAEELEGARSALDGGKSLSVRETTRAFEHIMQMIADVLGKYDIEAFRSESANFDQKIQQCVRTVPTQLEADHKKIAAVGAVGFRSSDLVIRKEQVTVYKYTPEPATPSNQTSSSVESS